MSCGTVLSSLAGGRGVWRRVLRAFDRRLEPFAAPSKPETGPQRALLRRVERPVGGGSGALGPPDAEARAEQAEPAAEQAARRGDEPQLRLLAVALPEEGAHVAQRVDEAELQPLPA